ncbi:histidine kinase-like ATPase [Coemansia mojavensis]|nr:histidine kinase-like ATPase [Coemansia mojavensis]
MITALPPETVRSIRSTFTIPDVSSVVIALLENSIDACATRIQVQVDLAQRFVEVKDDGCGIAGSEFSKLGKRFMTSKHGQIQSEPGRKMLGYRGEALASMSVIGIVEVKSRHKGMTFRCLTRNEQQIFCESCNTSSLDVYATTVRISSLFAQFPVRQALLSESAKKTTEKIKQMLQTRLLAYPEIALQFIADSTGSQSFTYAKAQSLNRRAAQIYGPMVAQLLDTISLDYGSYSLYGSISREPVQGRIQHIFIDSRPCTALELIGIVRSTLMTESYSALGRSESAAQLPKTPAFVLNISCKSCTSYTPNVDDQVGWQRSWDLSSS